MRPSLLPRPTSPPLSPLPRLASTPPLPPSPSRPCPSSPPQSPPLPCPWLPQPTTATTTVAMPAWAMAMVATLTTPTHTPLMPALPTPAPTPWATTPTTATVPTLPQPWLPPPPRRRPRNNLRASKTVKKPTKNFVMYYGAAHTAILWGPLQTLGISRAFNQGEYLKRKTESNHR